MVGIPKINISDKELKYYKQWIKETQDKSIQEYVAEQIMNKLQTLKKQEGKCEQRSILLEKGSFKGSCVWNSHDICYKVYIRTSEHGIIYGFFSNLYYAELELQRLFENKEEDIWSVAKKQQKYYQLQHRLTTRPRITDNTKNIVKLEKGKVGVIFLFGESFINPITKKQQKGITFGKWCMDDGAMIIQYREDLKQRLKEHKQKEEEA